MWELYVSTDFFIESTIVYLDAQGGNDYIFFGDGVNKKCNDVDRWSNVTGEINRITANFTSSSVIIIFTSDGLIADDGFQIKFSAVERNRTLKSGKPSL